MRQWELIGITDQAPTPAPPARRFVDIDTARGACEGRPVFFWTTDTALRMRTVTGAAAEMIGINHSKCEGRDLLALFGMEGENLAILEAHVAALGGDTVEFILHGDRGTVRCEVSPTHDADDHVIGTFCLALEVQDVDLRDEPVRTAVA
jgi:hypothetical protein